MQSDIFTIPLALSGQEVLTTGRVRASSPDGTLPVVIKAADVHFDPASVSNLECVCVRAVALDAFGPGNAGVGEIGCGAAGLPDTDVTYSRDHDIRNVDPACTTGTPDPLTGACIGPLTVTRSGGPGPRGSAVLRINVAVEEIPGTCAMETTTKVCQGGPTAGNLCFGDGTCGQGGECVPAKGPDGIPCNADDPQDTVTIRNGLSLVATATLVVTTGMARAEVLNANSNPGERIGVDSADCPEPCRAKVSGAPFDCSALAANPSGGVSGAKLVSAFPFISNSGIGDTVTTGVTPLLGLPKLVVPIK